MNRLLATACLLIALGGASWLGVYNLALTPIVVLPLSAGINYASMGGETTDGELKLTVSMTSLLLETGIGERLVAERRAAWEHWYAPVASARWASSPAAVTSFTQPAVRSTYAAAATWSTSRPWRSPRTTCTRRRAGPRPRH